MKESYEMEKKLERHRQNQHDVHQTVDHKGLVSYYVVDHKNKVLSKHDYKSDAYERAAELNKKESSRNTLSKWVISIV